MKKYNVGIAFLRILMCFQVVVDHFYSFTEDTFLCAVMDFYSSLAVPIFVILSFMYLDIEMLSSSREYFLKRMYRLVVPHMFWALAYYVIYWLLDCAYGYSLGIHRGIKGLLSLVITGSALNPAAWFIVDLIIVTVLFTFGYKLIGHRHELFMLIIIMAMAWILQYTGIWYKFVAYIFSDTPFYWTIGRIIEIIPFALLGLLLRKYDIMGAINNTSIRTRIITVTISALGIVMLAFLRDSMGLANDFMYGGILRAVKALITTILFGTIGGCCRNNSVGNVIVRLSKHTMAVFFMHNMVGTIMFEVPLLIPITETLYGTILGCVIIFVISMVIAILMCKIPSKIVRLAMS